jgi:hypothetical protein
MNNLVEKLSSYNLLNNLLPGIVFSYVATEITDYNLTQKDLLIGLFFYYVVGLIIGRIGSLILEPLLKTIAPNSKYEDFINASKIDKKLEVLSETNNIYRTIVSIVFSLFIIKGYNLLEVNCDLFGRIKYLLLGISLLVLFVFSYRKQTKYITGRVSTALKRGE